ncbi:MAG: hypothetical protein AABX47_10260 [Nanoarchaeota archaeon]
MSELVIDSAVCKPVFSDDKEIFHEEVVAVISSIREELDDHRQAINENTEEVGSNFDFLVEIAKKVDSISERLDALQLQVSKCKVEPQFQVGSLTNREKQVFSAIYSLTEDDPEVGYHQISSKMGSSEVLVAGYISNLIEKGVPVKKRYVGKAVKLSLDAKFRQEQAKANLVHLDAPLTAWM